MTTVQGQANRAWPGVPRWAGLLDGGRGDALFTFYPPLCYFASAVLMKAFRLDVLTSIKAVTFLVLFIAQASAYLLAREFFSRRRSLLVSLLFVLLPAYPLICLHRAFLANAFALSFAPPALLGAHRLLEGKRRASGLAIFALSFSAIVLTHAITTYLTALTIGLMTLVWLPRVGRRGLGRLAAAGAMTLTLVAFFLAEMGDKTQVATIGLAAHYHAVLVVAAGTTLGMMLANVPVVWLGARFAAHIPLRTARITAALLFLALGLWNLHALLA